MKTLTYSIGAALIIILLSILAIFYYPEDTHISSVSQSPSDTISKTNPPGTEKKIHFNLTGKTGQTETTAEDKDNEKDAVATDSKTNGNNALTDTLSSSTASISLLDASPGSSSTCKISANIVKDFYSLLDSREYINQNLQTITSQQHFGSLLQKLADNPPVVSKETDDLYTLLKNTAHFFRIIGNDNIELVKMLLNNEKKEYEQALPHFYYVISRPKCLQSEFSITITDEVLYDYAGFFLSTMAGRLYLFRRDVFSRLTVTYYSILLLDQANERNENRHGLDILPFIRAVIPEIENSNQQIALHKVYLSRLYELENKYSNISDTQ